MVKKHLQKKNIKNVFFWSFRPFPDFYFEKQGGLRKPRQVLRPSSKLAIGFFEICLRKRQKKIQILKKMTTSLKENPLVGQKTPSKKKFPKMTFLGVFDPFPIFISKNKVR